MLVAALKKALGAFGWTESVRREPRSLLHVVRPKAGAGGTRAAARDVGCWVCIS